MPGTTSWERALRDALSRSFGVVLSSSPSACYSAFVQTEVAIARSAYHSCLGQWCLLDSIRPMSASQMQYADLREEAYPDGLRLLAQRLTELQRQRKPRHTLVVDAFESRYEHVQGHHGFGVPGYLTIQMDQPHYNRPSEERHRDERAIVLDPDTFESLQALLD